MGYFLSILYNLLQNLTPRSPVCSSLTPTFFLKKVFVHCHFTLRSIHISIVNKIDLRSTYLFRSRKEAVVIVLNVYSHHACLREACVLSKSYEAYVSQYFQQNSPADRPYMHIHVRPVVTEAKTDYKKRR